MTKRLDYYVEITSSALTDELKLGEDSSDPIKVHPVEFIQLRFWCGILGSIYITLSVFVWLRSDVNKKFQTASHEQLGAVKKCNEFRAHWSCPLPTSCASMDRKACSPHCHLTINFIQWLSGWAGDQLAWVFIIYAISLRPLCNHNTQTILITK